MSDQGDEIMVRLRRRRDPATGVSWLYLPVNVAPETVLFLVPNSIATQSVITPDAARRLREAGLVGAEILDLRSRRSTSVISDVSLAGRSLGGLRVQVRDVAQLTDSQGNDLVDGYPGMDFFFLRFTEITIHTRTFRLTLRLDAASRP